MAIYKAQTKLENYIDFQDVEPKNPVKGQKYYDGEKVQTWNGKEWEVVVNPTQLEKDVASAVQAGESAGEKADEAKSDSSKAVESANSAVNKANSASDDASFAKNTANEAKQNAVNATNTAKTAKENATQALSDAAASKKQAGIAKENADKAISDASSALAKSDKNEESIISVNQTVDTVKGDLSSKVNQTDYDTLKGTVEEQSTSISQNANNIQTKADAKTVDTLNKTVKDQGTSIEQNAKTITSKANSKTVDSINEAVGQHSTEISQNAKDIKSKASAASVDDLKSTVSNQETSIEQNAQDIKLKASSQDVDTLKGTVSDQGTEISQNAEDIKLKANSQDVDTINQTVKSHGTEISQNAKAIKTKAEQSNVDNVSGEVKTLSTTVEQQAGKIETVSSKTDGNTTAIGKIESSYDGLKSTVSEVKDDVETAGGKISTLEQNLSGFKSTVQNEKADKSTVTQLADQWQQTTDLVDGHTSQISSLGSDLNLRVEKDDVINQINISDENILIDSAKTHITGKTTIDEGVISTAHIKNAAITSAKIKSITAGKIEAGTVKGLVLSSESATGKFNVEGQRAVFENTDTSERTELSDGGLIVYDRNRNMKSQITQQMVNSSYFGTSNVNTYITVGSLSTGDDMAEEGSGEFRIVDYDPRMAKENGMGDGRDDYTYLNVRANALFANVIRVNYADRKDGVVNNHLYLQPRWGYEIRLTAPGTTAGNSVYQNLRAKDLYANVLQSNSADGDNHVYIRPINSGELRVMNPDNTSFRNVRANDMYIRNIVKPIEGDLYIGTSGKVRIMGRGLWEDSNYRPIVSSAFQNPSLETFKTNIRKYEDDALSVIDNAEIYNYELKSDVREGINENHIGLIIGDDYQTPDCIKSDDNSAIDLYAMSSVGWKAIQELSEKIKDLRSEMDLLRKEINNE